MTTLDDLARGQRALAADVAAVRRELAELRAEHHSAAARRPLAPRDREWLTVLSPAIDAAVGDAVRTTAELAGLALHRDNAALAAALAGHVRGRGGLRALGKSLSRCSGHVVGGFELRHVGGSRDGALWQVVRV